MAPNSNLLHSLSKSCRDVSSLGLDPESAKSARPGLKDVRQESVEPVEPSRSDRIKMWSQLLVFSLAELTGGLTYSLLSPFYTKEATAKGLSVSQTGLVSASSFAALLRA